MKNNSCKPGITNFPHLITITTESDQFDFLHLLSYT